MAPRADPAVPVFGGDPAGPDCQRPGTARTVEGVLSARESLVAAGRRRSRGPGAARGRGRRLLALGLALGLAPGALAGVAACQRGPRVEGRVLDPGGAALPDVAVTLGAGQGEAELGRTDGRGRFALRAPASGTASLVLERDGYVGRAVPLTIAPGGATLEDLVLHPLPPGAAIARLDGGALAALGRSEITVVETSAVLGTERRYLCRGEAPPGGAVGAATFVDATGRPHVLAERRDDGTVLQLRSSLASMQAVYRRWGVSRDRPLDDGRPAGVVLRDVQLVPGTYAWVPTDARFKGERAPAAAAPCFPFWIGGTAAPPPDGG